MFCFICFIAVAGLTLVLVLTFAEADHIQKSISVSSDGWRPIVGVGRQPSSNIKQQQITQYKNPSQTADVEIVKVETSVLPTSTAGPRKQSTKVSTETALNNINGDKFQKQVFRTQSRVSSTARVTTRGKATFGIASVRWENTAPFEIHVARALSHYSIESRAPYSHRRSAQQTRSVPPGAQTTRQQAARRPFPPNLKRKPVRGPIAAQSSRDEVFVRPPSAGAFSSFHKGPVKTRDTQTLVGTGHFSIKPSTHVDFGNGFVIPPPSENFQQFKSNPVLVFTQTPAPSRFQNDVYTRNLVPPPFQQEPERAKVKDAVTESAFRLSDFNAQQFAPKPAPQFQENLVPQLASPFEQGFAFQKPFGKPKDAGADVQVTKEKLKVFHANAQIYNPNDYPDYEFHAVKKPANLPKLQTYEVTEGKWIDNPNPFTFNFMDVQPAGPPKIVTLPSARPTPIVELNVSPFLPTPYRPEGALPTSPTQREVSTVFSQVSSKMNRYKNEALTTNPLFFDVKEVSTHYPILGQPSPIPDPNPTDVNGELSNEITTPRQVQIVEEIAPKVTKRPKHRRRRPQPRRTTTTSTTTAMPTTTEDVPVTESYEVQKTQDNYEEASMEVTERPYRRQRPRPHRIRTNNNNYDAEGATEKRVRGRTRVKQRGEYGTRTDVQNEVPQRRRRPPQRERPSNHKMTDDSSSMSDETTEFQAPDQLQAAVQETQGIFETKYAQESFLSNEEATTVKSGGLELPGRHYESDEENRYETTAVSGEASERPRYEEAKEAETEGVQERTTTERDYTLNNVPENEVDYSTPYPVAEPNDEGVQTTLATPPPTTTTESTTTKSHRIRGETRQRLNQYTSTTPSTTTDIVKATGDGVKLRFPNRKLRVRPTTARTTTVSDYEPEEEHSEPIRRGFKPKEPRHGGATTDTPYANIITEKAVKSVNTRLRPFGRQKSTTEAPSSTPKISIKPNLFSARRRTPQLNLKMKIYNKLNRTEETTAYSTEAELTEPATVQTETEDEKTTETVESVGTKSPEVTEATTQDLSDDDYSQRVSDLTSSFKTQYETPGLTVRCLAGHPSVSVRQGLAIPSGRAGLRN
ncbi:hypothetical protein NQ318_018933 [Aromia moschata]|uniref:Uncharacterized protein n=1 Tax=Aromia moschata TaxID=1265417 RepID=A0AAV8ZGB5_9CUCU|nr:hypothetical protein NQ318_018933 [Aromia moschata]